MGVPYSVFCCNVARLEALIAAATGTTYTGSNGVQLIGADFSADATIARLASPAFTGVPTAPTAAPATNTTQIATTAFVLANAGGSYTAGTGLSLAGSAFSIDATVALKSLTLAQFAATTSAQLAALITNETGTNLLVFNTNPILDGPRIISGILDSNSVRVLDFAQVASAVSWVQITNASAGNAPVISPEGAATNIDLSFLGKGTGIVRIPTATVGTNTTQAASTAFVQASFATRIGLNLALISGNYLN